MLEYIKFFYQKEQMDDRTSKKALVFEMVNAYSGFRLPTIPMAHMFEHSPIEHLFYISLCSTMPAAHLEFKLYYAAKNSV